MPTAALCMKQDFVIGKVTNLAGFDKQSIKDAVAAAKTMNFRTYATFETKDCKTNDISSFIEVSTICGTIDELIVDHTGDVYVSIALYNSGAGLRLKQLLTANDELRRHLVVVADGYCTDNIIQDIIGIRVKFDFEQLRLDTNTTISEQVNNE